MKNNLINYKEIENILGYDFADEELLLNALTHSSYASEHDKRYRFNNERLEFIGDGYLDAIIGNRLYNLLPDSQEGILSKTRANIVCEKSLARISRNIGLGKYLLLGRGESESGGRDKDSILADALEAVIGAIKIDGGYEVCEEFVLRVFEENITLAVQGRLFRDYKTELQERLQEKYKSVAISYRLVGEKGPDHRKEFTVAVNACGRDLGMGTGYSKKEAEQNAAKDVILKGEL